MGWELEECESFAATGQYRTSNHWCNGTCLEKYDLGPCCCSQEVAVLVPL